MSRSWGDDMVDLDRDDREPRPIKRGRARPWQNPTPLEGFQPEWIGQFDTFDDWVNHASRALTGLRLEDGINFDVVAFCVDAKGRRCTCGKEFMRARDDGSFPVRYFITGSVVRSNELGGARGPA